MIAQILNLDASLVGPSNEIILKVAHGCIGKTELLDIRVRDAFSRTHGRGSQVPRICVRT